MLKKSASLSLIVSIIVVSILVQGCQPKKKPGTENTLHTFVKAKIKGLDPIFADDLYSGNEVSRVYEGLLQYHYLKRPYELIPNLAESMPQISADGKTFTFKLKKGVVFQDDPCFAATAGKGREMVAEDFIYSFKRLADPKNMSPGWWIFDGKVSGLNEWRDLAAKTGKADYAAAVPGLKALDSHTLQIQLKSRSYQFLYFLAMPFALVVPHEAVEKYGAELATHPVGTGAFKLKAYNPSEKIVYVRNPTFRKEFYPSEGEPSDQAAGNLADAGKLIPFVDEVQVQIFTENQPLWLNFLNGNLDHSDIPKENYSQVIDSRQELKPDIKSKNLTLIKSEEVDTTHDSFNMSDPLIGKNKALRQAMSLAMNPVPHAEIFYNNRAILAQGPVPPGMAGYDPQMKSPYRQFDLNKAKELMKKAGYPDGKGLPELEYNTIANSDNRQMTEYLSKSFEALGIKMKVSSYSWPEFQNALKNKKGHMWGFAWGADYPDAENFLQLFYSKNASPGPNDSNYSNPEFDRLYEKSLTLRDGPERTQVYQQMIQIVVEDCPWIFGVHRLKYHLVQPWLKNYKPHVFQHAISKYFRIQAPAN